MIYFSECFFFNQKKISNYNLVTEIIYQIGGNVFYPCKQVKMMTATHFIILFGIISYCVQLSAAGVFLFFFFSCPAKKITLHLLFIWRG